jgi:hypothetical protein
MKREVKLGILLVVLIAVVPWQAVPAQDFSALLEAVNRIETNLKQLVEQEKQQRQAQFAELQTAIEQMPAQQSATVAEPDLSGLEAQIAELKLAVQEIRLASEVKPSDDRAMVDMMHEMSVLRAEMAELENQMHPAPQTASTDPIAYTAAPEAAPAEGSLGGIEWSGFFDVNGTMQSSADDETNFGLGQAEIGLASEIADNVAVEAAIAYNADDGLFELGAAILDVNLYSGGNFLSSVDFAAGQFDVPFGIDLNWYPSIERKLVTGPTAVDLTHGGWNDLGFQMSLEASHGNFVFYMVNGFESSVEVLDEIESLALGEDVYEEVDTSPANAIGTRLGIAPMGWLELGTSFAAGWNASGESEMALAGADLQMSLFNFDLKGEYIAHSINRSIAEENNRGYYAQMTYSFLGRAFVTTRYGGFKPEGADWHDRSSLGAGYAINDGLELRFEQVFDENSDDNQTILQMVAGF